MDIKFNSLFDQDDSDNSGDLYSVDNVDTTLLLSNLVLSEDIGKRKAVEKLEDRTFGNYPNYLLSGRPCATRGCPPEKFCDSSGWPTSKTFVPENKCAMPFAPNSSRGDPNIHGRNIDVESKLYNIDFIDSKCHLNKHKEDPCKDNPDTCVLGCHRDIIASDYMLPKTINWDVNKYKPSSLEDTKKRIEELKKVKCHTLEGDMETSFKMLHFMPSRRRNVINWD